MYFHGFPSSRLEASAVDGLARKRNIRLISPDRPGFGLSSPQPNRQMKDWPVDVEVLAKHLGLSRFAVLGGSGGGPYSLACAKFLPRDMLSAVGLFASGPPWVAGAHHMPFSARILAPLARNWPSGTRVLFDGIVGATKWSVTTNYVSKAIDGWLEKLDQKEREMKSLVKEEQDRIHGSDIKERRERLLRITLEAFAQGSQGTVDETNILTGTSWGFEFEDVDFDKVQIWHGTQDSRAPISMIRYLAERLPHCELVEWDERGHFDLLDEVDEVMTGLIPQSLRESSTRT